MVTKGMGFYSLWKPFLNDFIKKTNWLLMDRNLTVIVRVNRNTQMCAHAEFSVLKLVLHVVITKI